MLGCRHGVEQRCTANRATGGGRERESVRMDEKERRGSDGHGRQRTDNSSGRVHPSMIEVGLNFFRQ